MAAAVKSRPAGAALSAGRGGTVPQRSRSARGAGRGRASVCALLWPLPRPRAAALGAGPLLRCVTARDSGGSPGTCRSAQPARRGEGACWVSRGSGRPAADRAATPPAAAVLPRPPSVRTAVPLALASPASSTQGGCASSGPRSWGSLASSTARGRRSVPDCRPIARSARPRAMNGHRACYLSSSPALPMSRRPESPNTGNPANNGLTARHAPCYCTYIRRGRAADRRNRKGTPVAGAGGEMSKDSRVTVRSPSRAPRRKASGAVPPPGSMDADGLSGLSASCCVPLIRSRTLVQPAAAHCASDTTTAAPRTGLTRCVLARPGSLFLLRCERFSAPPGCAATS